MEDLPTQIHRWVAGYCFSIREGGREGERGEGGEGWREGVWRWKSGGGREGGSVEVEKWGREGWRECGGGEVGEGGMEGVWRWRSGGGRDGGSVEVEKWGEGRRACGEVGEGGMEGVWEEGSIAGYCMANLKQRKGIDP